jgi:hypothetical protein
VQIYTFYLLQPGGDLQDAAVEVHQCATDAQALAEGCRALRRAVGVDAIEVWREAQRLLKLGGREPEARPGYLGRWDKAAARR